MTARDAVTNLIEFLDVEDLDDTVLNAGNEQRLILVAANFRKEVTATVLWLIGHGVRAQCFRVLPYSLGEEVLIDLQQIIPVPEAADYMIGMAAKESEEKSVQGAQKRIEERRIAFWTKILEELRRRDVALYANISPSKTPLAGQRHRCVRLQVQPDLYQERGARGALPGSFSG